MSLRGTFWICSLPLTSLCLLSVLTCGCSATTSKPKASRIKIQAASPGDPSTPEGLQKMMEEQISQTEKKMRMEGKSEAEIESMKKTMRAMLQTQIQQLKTMQAARRGEAPPPPPTSN